MVECITQGQKSEVERLGKSNALLLFRCDAAEARADALQADAAAAASKHEKEISSLKGTSKTITLTPHLRSLCIVIRGLAMLSYYTMASIQGMKHIREELVWADLLAWTKGVKWTSVKELHGEHLPVCREAE